MNSSGADERPLDVLRAAVVVFDVETELGDLHHLVVRQDAAPALGRVEFLDDVSVGTTGDAHRLTSDLGVAQHGRGTIDVVRIGLDSSRHHDLAESERRLRS